MSNVNPLNKSIHSIERSEDANIKNEKSTLAHDRKSTHKHTHTHALRVRLNHTYSPSKMGVRIFLYILNQRRQYAIYPNVCEREENTLRILQ